MDIITVFFISVGLAMDCFAVSIACTANLRSLKPHNYLIPGISFGLFQASMFLGGLFLGSGLSRFIQVVDHWIAFGLLLGIGLKMIFQKRKEDCEEEKCMLENPSVLLVLSVATSIDALVVGFGIGVLKSSIIIPTLMIGVVTFLLTIIGRGLGKKLGSLFAKKAEILGGLILIGIGVKILITHLS